MPTHRKILLVDDDADDQLFFVDAIKELIPTVECSFACNGIEALEYLEKVPPLPSLIFLDLNMPFMNGFECLAELKRKNEYDEIPVIIFSTSNNPIDKERIIAMGVKVFLTKPPDFAVLKNKLHDILQTDFSVSPSSL